MNHSKKARLTEGGVFKTLATMVIPMLMAIMTMVGFNLVDTYFIGQLGTTELAAISFTFPVIMLLASLSQGLGVGASAVISRAIGEGDHDRVRRLTTDGLLLSLLIVIVFGSIGLLTIDPLFTALGAKPDVLPFIREYMALWYIALMFVVVPMVGNSAIRATGDATTPAIIMFIAVGVNLVLDPLLIFGIGDWQGMGIQGAALATAISRMVTMVASLWVLTRREKMLTFVKPALADVTSSWRKILHVGIPAAGTQMLNPISIAIITRLVAAYGSPAVAAFGVASRIEFFAIAVMMAVSTVLTPFVGQNWGAGKLDRVDRAITLSERFAIGWGVLIAVILALFGRPIAGLFDNNPEVIAWLVIYLLIVPISYTMQGTLLAVNATLNALNRPLQSTALMILRLLVLYVPLAAIGSALYGLIGIFGAASLANLLAGAAAMWWLHNVMRRELAADTPKSDVPITPKPATVHSSEGG